jgi:hypothetical protein
MADGRRFFGWAVGPRSSVVPGDRSAAPWRRPSALAIGIAGVALYNWWVPVALSGRLLTTPDELFSDLEATGRPDAALLQHLDLTAGILLATALLLRGRQGPQGPRAEWPWLMAFALSGVVGGRFPYACPEGSSAICRSAEWRLALPGHHYVHVVAGIVEFATATIAVYLAWQRTRSDEPSTTRVVRWTGRALVIAYPVLGLAYLSDRLGALVEPVFFVTFSTIVLAELFEPDRVAVPPAAAGRRQPQAQGSPDPHTDRSQSGPMPTEPDHRPTVSAPRTPPQGRGTSSAR